MTSSSSSSSTSRAWVWEPGPLWVRALHTALEYLCWATRHRGGCWLLNDWRVGRWLVQHAYTTRWLS